MSHDAPRPIRSLHSTLNEVVLVCRKCSRKLDGGFGPDGQKSFAKALRHAIKQRSPSGHKVKKRKQRMAVVEVDCLDVCPKKGVVAFRADRPGEWLVIPRDTPMHDVVDRLGLVALMGPTVLEGEEI